MNKIKLTMLATAIMSLSVFAQETQQVNASDVHGNIHDEATATSIYTSWKSTRSGDDPFKRVAQGYGIEKDNNRETYALTTYQTEIDTFVAAALNSKTTEAEARRTFRNDSISEMYETAYDEDEGFDTQAYSDAYLDYLEQKNTRASTFYEEHQATLADMGINSTLQNQNDNSFSAQRSHTATANLLGIISNDIFAQKEAIQNAFTDNLTEAQQSITFGDEASVLASTFSGDCPACAFTENPVEDIGGAVEPPEEPPTTDPVFVPPAEPCVINDPWRYWHYYKCP